MKYIIERISIRPERNILYFIYSKYGEKPKNLKTFEMEGKTFTEKVERLVKLALEGKLLMGTFQKNVVKFFNIIKGLVAVDCSGKRRRTLTATVYSKSGNPIGSNTPSYAEWRYVIPGTGEEGMYKFVCNHDPR